MNKTKFIGWLLGGLITAILGFSLVPTSAVASPLFGFTDTPVPPPTEQPPTQPPPPPKPPTIVDPIITKRANVERARVGDLVEYTLEITNPNNVDISNVVVTDQLPEVVDFISTSTPQGTYNYDAATRTLTYNLGTLTAGQALRITILTRVNSKATAPDQFGNVAVLTWDDGRSVTSNSVVITITPSDLPGAGVGPGWGEIAVIAGALLASLAGLSLAGLGVWRLVRRA